MQKLVPGVGYEKQQEQQKEIPNVQSGDEKNLVKLTATAKAC